MLSICVTALILTQVALLSHMTNAACSTKTTCEECLMSTPAWTFWTEGDYCKFCPSPSLTHRFPFDDEARFVPTDLGGACFDDSSSDDRAKNTVTTPAPVLGGCSLSKSNDYVTSGWLIPGKNHTDAKSKDTRVKDLAQVKRICEGMRSLYTRAVSGSSGSGSSAKVSSSMLLAGADATNALRMATHVATQVRRDIILMLKLRAVDPHFFYQTFPQAELADQLVGRYAWKTTSTTVKLFVPYANYIIDGVSAIDAAAKLLSDRAEPIMYYGGAANTYSFPDVDYKTLYSAYIFVLKALKAEASNGTVTPAVAKALLNKLKKEADEHLQSAATTAKNVAAVTHKVNSHPATTGVKITAHVLAAVLSGGLSLPVSAGIAAGELILDSSLEAVAEHSTRDKVRIMVASELNLEGAVEGIYVLDKTVNSNFNDKEFVKGPLFCDITNYKLPNHGCSAGMRCVRRQGAFFPLNVEAYSKTYQTSHGHCAPVDSPQLDVGAPCVADIDCRTGFCDAGSVEISVTIDGAVKKVQISSSTRAYRGDMKIDVPYFNSALTPEQRITATHGFCRVVAKPGTPEAEGCEPIVSDVKFLRCKDKPIPREFFATPPDPLKLSRSTSDESVGSKTPEASSLKRSTSLGALQPNKPSS